MLRTAEIVSVFGGIAFAVAISNDVPVAKSVAERVVFGIGMAVCWVLLLAREDSTNQRILGRGIEEFVRVFVATGKLLAIVAVVVLVLGVPIPRQTLGIAFICGFVGCMSAHLVSTVYIGSRRRRHGAASTRVLIVGTPESAVQMRDTMTKNPALGYVPVGIVDPPVSTIQDPTMIEDPGYIVGAARNAAAEYIVIASSTPLETEWLRALRFGLSEAGVGLLIAPSLVGLARPKVTLESIGDVPLIHVDEPGYSSRSGWGKALFDRAVATAGLLVLSPLLLAVAIAIKVSDRGPVFYRPERIGREGATFRMWKFRSMYQDADKRLADLRANGAIPDDQFFKMQKDPRITAVGRIIRRTSIDEFPQLLNVIFGEMSLVGPRPLVHGEGHTFPGFVERRQLVKPGMTGLWQVSGRSDTTDEQRVELDVYYVENWSIEQDVRILLRTIVTVARGDGAY
ncbi:MULTISPECIES: sugar transferase [Gordonia]|uniref:Putative glycosyltransferase n=1 Tax=Gordonia sputi NBRC 100414 TaxID=1089453 RepID=H5U6C1_9ACTN|nr:MULTISPECIES: sugar transferase [Gordonia]NKY92193.1 sugar transferase [Gordonia sputi]OBA73823.1 UDP-phosphate galactose phosphotransferase [Gordonia sp. 852002-10350_SCH5691597]GAB41279.1 putative glycosyltransferase [Gordonia sputi NBRC 100414]